ncbi:MAG: HAD-IIIA family hydrolase [Deltaproteobacteria bacterium]|nr:HAD-IIIA family hydrolase [Deltaproteobacteria bacterium]
MKRAVFLDRDGVINPEVLNPSTGQWESPHKAEGFTLFPWTASALRLISKHGYLLFLASNQPDFAKGKTPLEDLIAIHEKFASAIQDEGICFSDFFYCFHHPSGNVPGYSRTCACRKPNPYFLLTAKKKWGLEMNLSWMVGDRHTDILCGKAAGTKTILIHNEYAKEETGGCPPDFTAVNLKDAARIITGFF